MSGQVSRSWKVKLRRKQHHNIFVWNNWTFKKIKPWVGILVYIPNFHFPEDLTQSAVWRRHPCIVVSFETEKVFSFASQSQQAPFENKLNWIILGWK